MGVLSHAQGRRPSLAEVEALFILTQRAWHEVLDAALQLPDEGSGERWFNGQPL